MIKRLLFVALLTAPSFLFAQIRTISGVVKDPGDGSGIPGVNVVIDGTARGTSTDVQGNFKVQLEATEDVLVFSFIGYKTQRVVVGSKTELQVTMESEATQLDEIVVVGYGEQKKSDITGSTANVKGDELLKQPVLTATQAIQGKVAGVQIITSGQPGSSPQIRVRGVGTALGGTTSLFVVDGVLTDDISNVNTADIVEMNILKDASSAAIYGSRGANGVIIITTKKGSSGKLKINYNNNVGFRQAANLVKMANSTEYSNYAQAATGNAPPASSFNTDWYGTILRTAIQQSHNLSLSGGTDKSTYLFNVGYLVDEGIVINNDFKRLTVRFNSDYQLSEKLKFGYQTSFGNSTNQNAFGNINIDAFGNIGAVYNNAYRASPTIASRVDGRYGNTSTYQNVGNPLLDINNNSIRVNENRLQGSTFLSYKPVEWLTLRSSLGADWRSSLNRGYYYQFNADENTFLISGGNQLRAQSSLVSNGYGKNGSIVKNNTYFSYKLPLESPSPLFWVHYSYLGLDPHFTDDYANYWEQNVNASLINYAYCVANPKKFIGYSDQNWGLTSSDNQSGYSAHSPTNDLGVITPTAALSSFPYTPDKSMKALKFFYYTLGDKLWGPYGFYDAFNITSGWTASSYLAIDQGPIVVMIENYRTGLLWNLFMSAPEVQQGMDKLDFVKN